MKTVPLLIIFFLLFPNSLRAGEEKAFLTAPSNLPSVTRQMHTAGFWIGRHPSADEMVMSPDDIVVFNNHIQNDLKLTKDIFSVTANFTTDSLMEEFTKTLADFTDKGYCTLEGERNSKVFIDEARRNMNLSGVVLGIAPRYGLVVQYANVRFLPVSKGLYESPGDVDFDMIQNSSLDVGSPVAVVHQSRDKKWYYVYTQNADGWVQADRVALGDVRIVQDYVESKAFVVVTKPKGDIFLNEGMTRYYDYARMGSRLALSGVSLNRVNVLVPVFGKEKKLEIVSGYMSSADVHEGFLPYTPRVIYTQAFAMLNEPYGWGGMYGQQDCSAFLDGVFKTVGIMLPRDSKNQAKVGRVVASFDDNEGKDFKIDALKKALEGITILPMKGHIMLYAGTIDGIPYAVHAVWAYRENKAGKDVPRVLNKVVVSSLNLGEGSQKGSLLKRLSKIIEIKQ